MRIVLGLIAALIAQPAFAQSALAQSAADVLGAAGVAPLATPQPTVRIIVDPPLPGSLAQGKVFIQYRAENLRIEAVFGDAALLVTPRIGHVHVAVDHAPWHWVDASGETIILVALPPGHHQVGITGANANHQRLGQATVAFVVPAGAQSPYHGAGGRL